MRVWIKITTHIQLHQQISHQFIFQCAFNYSYSITDLNKKLNICIAFGCDLVARPNMGLPLAIEFSLYFRCTSFLSIRNYTWCRHLFICARFFSTQIEWFPTEIIVARCNEHELWYLLMIAKQLAIAWKLNLLLFLIDFANSHTQTGCRIMTGRFV